MWQIAVNGQVLGAMTSEQVAASVQSGQIGANAYVAGGHLSDWTPIAQVPELAYLLAGGHAPAAPAMAQPQPVAAPAAVNPPAEYANVGQGAPMAYANVGQGAAAAYANVGQGAPAAVAQAQAAPGQGPSEESGDWLKERIKGVKSIGIGILLLILNFATIWFLESYYPVMVIFALGSFGYGGWVMVFGDEFDDRTMQLVMWKRVGMWACGILGGLAGLALSGFLSAG